MPGGKLKHGILLPLAFVPLLLATEYHGEVLFNGLPVPGVILTATQGKTKEVAVTDERGFYSFANLADGTWTLRVESTGFAPREESVTVSPGLIPGKWDLTILSAEQILAVKPETPVVDAEGPPATDFTSEEANQGLLVNGSLNNGASSVFRQDASFGNHRKRRPALYNGGIGVILDNSSFDAVPFSLTGQNTPKPAYNDVTGIVSLGGPLRIPRILNEGPTFFLGYQWVRDRDALTQTAVVPSFAQRNSLLPATVDPAARSLLAYYPLPNFAGNSRYNFQIPTVSATHQDFVEARLDKTVRKNEFSGFLALQSNRSDTPNLLGYSDSSASLGINTRLNWSRIVHRGLLLNVGYQFSRNSVRIAPYFANKTNVSGNAGIRGNDQSSLNWGPPTLLFASGIASLTDALPASNHKTTNTASSSLVWTHRSQSITFGGDYRRSQLNYLGQQNPRGTLSFTGAATGSDFGDFLAGVPATSAIAFGNADKYLREPAYDGYTADDWRVNASLTVNAGIRWEYAAPMTELYNRLANLDLTSGFTSAAQVLAANPVGPLTGEKFSHALMQPDRIGWQPRIGTAWRAPTASPLVVRAGYGIYYNNAVYESIANQLAQQPPFSTAFNIQNTAARPLTIANAFSASGMDLPSTFAIDPHFRVGYVHNWQLSVQRDLPGSLVVIATYSGIKGTRGTQEFLPNTSAPGSVSSCTMCPAGFVYLTSNGNSTREALGVQLRRRLHNGFAAQLQYTLSKSLDNDSFLGGPSSTTTSPTAVTPTQTQPSQSQSQSQGSTAASTPAPVPVIAQNWLNLTAEKARSNFDQRHVFSAQLQYTSGMGARGGTLLSGWRGTLLKEWTFATQVTAGSGLPLNPVYFAVVPGTGYTGTVRPDYTGASLYSAASGSFLNPAAYAAPAPGTWGNAGRNSITGPLQFRLDATLGRTFRLRDRLNLDLRFDSTNVLNHVTYTSWNTVVNNAQFGLPVSANQMRRIQVTMRLRF